MNPKFIHLHTHSHYSLLNALPKIDDLIDEAKKCNMPALALTDAGNLYGAIEFYQRCKKKGIKAILGVDFYVALRTRKDIQAGIDNKRTRLVLLAKDYDGYKNLIKLVTDSYLEGFYYKPRIDRELIEKYKDNLICISPSFSSDISQAIKAKNIDKAKEFIEFYKKIYGNENFYIEITRHPEIQGHEALMQELIKLARETATPIVAGHDVYYLHPEDKEARDTLMLVNTSGDMSDRSSAGGGSGSNGGGMNGSDDVEDFSFISQEKAEELFRDIPEALANTIKIANQCNVEITLGKWYFPNFIVESGLSHDDELKRLAYEGIAKRGMTQTKEVIDRLEYELKVIKNKGYAQYFLVVSDLLHYAHEHGILTNIRGSVAGSLTTYLTKITNVDPLAYKLPFERFLNPERPSAPDIDMDFADNRRDEVIEYTRKKYGHDKVAQIGTFGTMMARGAVRDVARAMGYAYDIADRISKLIPMGAQGFPMTIDRALEEVAELKEAYEKEPDTKKIIDMAKKIEGCARHISVHAAGVVISPDPLTEHVPLQYDTKNKEDANGNIIKKIITQYDMHAVGEDGVGLLKFDFLGIKNLSILADAVERVKKIENKDIDIENIPIDDKKTFEMLARGETIGLFQLNGTGMTKFLVDLKPSRIHDINAMVALYRPGPLESIPQYIERKHDETKIEYLDPRMKDILDMSYGVITYQDDVMMIAIKLAGYSWLEADKLRKAMGKKIPKDMEEQKDKLLKGFEKNGLGKKKANELWKLIEPFAAYGFNKAHAASYGRVAYQTSYMKANFPAIYMSAVLTADSGDVEKIAEIIGECKRMKIPILPPDINESFSQFTVVKGGAGEETLSTSPAKLVSEIAKSQSSLATARFSPNQFQRHSDSPRALESVSSPITSDVSFAGRREDKSFVPKDTIRFGLVTIKNFGQGISTAIIAERKKNGKFKSLSDFLDRVKDKNLNKKSVEALIKVGALDTFGIDRGVLLGNVETILSYNKEKEKQADNQESLFGLMTDKSSIPGLKLSEVPNAEIREKLAWEKELLGLYISGHPLDRYREIIAKRDMDIKKAKETLKDGSEMTIACIIEEVKPIITKKGDSMAFVKVADFSGELETVIFPRVLVEFRSAFVPDKCIAIKGKMSERNGQKSMIVDKVKVLG
jgi:DNA polymerase-3 subunit alpha